jgi:hypothetical protein
MNITSEAKAKISSGQCFDPEVLDFIVSSGVLNYVSDIDSRWLEAAKMRLEEKLSFQQIGGKLGISQTRANALYKRCIERLSQHLLLDGLDILTIDNVPLKARHALNRAGIKTLEEFAMAIQNHPADVAYLKGFGEGSYSILREAVRDELNIEIPDWLNLLEQLKS